jgi:N-methylhydantoinase A
MSKFSRKKGRIGADIGGTFTDVVLESDGRRFSTKVLTTYDAPERALLEGVSLLLGEASLNPADIELVVHGTTLATNALIERRGATTGLLTTEGFRDVLDLGAENRFDQYDIGMEKPISLVPRKLRIGIPERMAADGAPLLPLHADAVKTAVRTLRDAGVQSVAIAFLHAYVNPAHERQAAEIVRAVWPDASLSLSSEVSPEMREYERFSTTVANAYVQPLVERYLLRLERRLAELGFDCPLYLMLSSGGLASVETAARFPVRLVESGPAGGAIFAAGVAQERGAQKVLALDVGGTTAKLCLIDHGAPQTSQMFEVARVHRFRKGSGLPLRIPVIEMVEIGAGGGSIAKVDAAGRLAVGPQSAGSEPGPAAYGRGGTAPTVTDADITLGRIDCAAFAGGKMKLNAGASAAALCALDLWGGEAGLAALAVSEIVDEAMASAARVHAMEQGASLEERVMVAFGGAAPLHAARLAEKLGIREVVIPRSAGVGSAVGFLRAPIAFDLNRSFPQALHQADWSGINALYEEMASQGQALVESGAPGQELVERRSCLARYRGQGYEIPVHLPARALRPDDQGLIADAFRDVYRAQYGGVALDLPIEILTWRLSISTERAAPPAPVSIKAGAFVAPPRTLEVTDPAAGKPLPFGVFRRTALNPGDRILGPALIIEDETTTLVSPAFDAAIDSRGYIVLTRAAREGGKS